MQADLCDTELQAQSGIQFALATYAHEWSYVPAPAIQTRISAAGLASAA
jgi:hypothetical protein